MSSDGDAHNGGQPTTGTRSRLRGGQTHRRFDLGETDHAAAGETATEGDGWFAALFDAAPVVCMLCDADGTLLAINPHAARELGYVAEDVAGLPVFDLLHRDHRRGLSRQLEAALGAPTPEPGRDLRLLRRDGSTVWVEGTVRSVADPAGVPLFLLCGRKLSDGSGGDERLLDYQARLRGMALELALAEEKERRRIAVGLHDDVGHNLALAKMMLSSEESGEGEAPPAAATEAVGLIDQAIQSTRALTFDLSSPILYELGLEAALQSAGDRIAEAHGLAFEFRSDGAPKPLDSDVMVILYRSAQELFVNMVKHAQASRFEVSVARAHDRVEITVTDDGIGFDTSAVLERAGPNLAYGLLSIQEQMRGIGGHLDLAVTRRGGTRCRLVARVTDSE